MGFDSARPRRWSRPTDTLHFHPNGATCNGSSSTNIAPGAERFPQSHRQRSLDISEVKSLYVLIRIGLPAISPSHLERTPAVAASHYSRRPLVAVKAEEWHSMDSCCSYRGVLTPLCSSVTFTSDSEEKSHGDTRKEAW